MSSDNSKLSSVFGHETEAGRMLAKLYGRPTLTEPIKKPTHFKKMEGPQPTMLSMHSRPHYVDPRSQTLNRAAMAVIDSTKPSPVVTRTVHVAPIDTIKGMIRSQAKIKEVEAFRAPTDVQMPPLKKGYNNPDAEKRRVQALFAFKGGRALPEAGLPEAIEGAVPLHMLTGGTRGSKHMRGGGGGTVPRFNTSPLLEELERTFAAVKVGLDDSVAFITEMRQLRRATRDHENNHALAVVEKTREMQRLEAEIEKEQARIKASKGSGGGGGGVSSSHASATASGDFDGFDGWSGGGGAGGGGEQDSSGNGRGQRSKSPVRFRSSSSSSSPEGQFEDDYNHQNGSISGMHVSKASLSPRRGGGVNGSIDNLLGAGGRGL